MSITEVGGGATGAVLLMKAIEFGIAYLRRRQRQAEDPIEVEVKSAVQQNRSFSPGQIAAVTTERIAAAQMAREELVDRVMTNNLLTRIATGIEDLTKTMKDRFDDVEEKIRKDLKDTRHGIRDDLQTIRIEMPGVCRAPGAPPLPAPRPRAPSRPGV